MKPNAKPYRLLRTSAANWFGALCEAAPRAWFLALLMAAGLAMCEADLLVPLFHERTFFIKVGFLIAAAIIQTPLLVPSAHRFVRMFSTDAGPVSMFSQSFVTLGLGIALAVMISGAAGQFLGAQSSGTYGAGVAGDPIAFNRAAVWIYLALFAIFLGLAHMKEATRHLTGGQRLQYPILFLVLCFAAIHLINSVLPLIDMTRREFAYPDVIPTYNPVGMDFRRGLYLPAQRLIAGDPIYPELAAKSPNLYPPLVILLGVPYLVFNEDAAYYIHVFVLVVANLLCLLLASLLAGAIAREGGARGAGEARVNRLSLLILVAFSLFSSYPFLFSIERGNIDAWAMMFALASIWTYLRYPDRVWWQVILLSIAIHIKVYPAFLLVPLFLAHRWRMVLPTFAANAALLLCLGPTNLIRFLGSLLKFYKPIVWVGNHSGYSFAGVLAVNLGVAGADVPTLHAIFTGIPFLIWIIGMLAVAQLGGREKASIWGLMITVPLMATFPSVSYDYQLVIVFAAILSLLSVILRRMAGRQNPEDYFQLLLVAVIVLFIGRSYMLMPSVSPLLQNKYAWLVLLQVVTLVHILQQRHDARIATSGTGSAL